MPPVYTDKDRTHLVCYIYGQSMFRIGTTWKSPKLYLADLRAKDPGEFTLFAYTSHITESELRRVLASCHLRANHYCICMLSLDYLAGFDWLDRDTWKALMKECMEGCW